MLRPALSPSKLAESAAEYADVFAALGDSTRLHIVARLCEEGPLAAARLTDGSGMSRQAIAKHLGTLQDAGLVTSRRAGREKMWGIQAGRLEEVRLHLERISSQWDRALSRLQAFVESDLPEA